MTRGITLNSLILVLCISRAHISGLVSLVVWRRLFFVELVEIRRGGWAMAARRYFERWRRTKFGQIDRRSIWFRLNLRIVILNVEIIVLHIARSLAIRFMQRHGLVCLHGQMSRLFARLRNDATQAIVRGCEIFLIASNVIAISRVLLGLSVVFAFDCGRRGLVLTILSRQCGRCRVLTRVHLIVGRVKRFLCAFGLFRRKCRRCQRGLLV